MKTVYILFTLWFICFAIADAQTPDWKWLRTSKGAGAQEGLAVAADNSGNVYVTGYFSCDSVTFGNITLADPQNHANGTKGVFFLTKYSSSGALLWVRSTNPTYAVGQAITTDAAGNVYVSGITQANTVIFDSSHIITDTLGASFIVKYDSLGNLKWVHSFYYGNGYNCIAADASGNVYTTGQFNGGSALAPAFTGGIIQYYVAKYDSSGHVLWAQTAHTSNDMWPAQGYNLTTDDKGHIYVTGTFSGDSLTFGTTTIYAAMGNNRTLFIAKYDSTGQLIWAESAASTYDIVPAAIATDGLGNFYLNGSYFGDSVTFGTYTFYNPSFTSPLSITSCLYLVKYNASGTVQWGQTAIPGGVPGLQNVKVYGLAVAAKGNIYITGNIFDSIAFGSTTLYPPYGATDPMFIAGYDPTGALACSTVLSSGGDDQNAICADPFGNIFIGGDYEDTVFEVGHDTATHTGYAENIFVAKFTGCGNNVNNGIADIHQNLLMDIFPNPNTGNATVRYLLPTGANHAQLIINDLLGRQSCSYQLYQAENTIGINGLSSGVYFASLVVNGTICFTQKMVVE